jgi:hypothetical protein
MALILAGTSHAAAQNSLYRATVSVPEAEVRSGPSASAELYPTNKLRQGEVVEVVKEMEGGWLAIKPPAGSFSWVNTRFLEPINRNTWVVIAHPDVRVPVLYGSTLRNEKPSVEGAKVQRGTQVSSIGPARSADDGMWLPIDPPPGEVRYIRADTTKANVVQTAATTTPPGSPAPGVVSAVPANYSSPGAAAPAAPVSDPRWQHAQQLEQTGNRVEAIRLYEQLGNAVRGTDADLAMRALNRAQYLRDQGTGQPPIRTASQQPAHPIPSADVRLQPVPVSLQVPSPPSPCVPCHTTASRSGALQRSGAGWLRRSAWWLDGQPTYSLVDNQGRVRMYVTAQPGLNLEPYLNRNVDLHGQIFYRGYPPVYHIRADQVVPAQ